MKRRRGDLLAIEKEPSAESITETPNKGSVELQQSGQEEAEREEPFSDDRVAIDAHGMC